jgi:MFS family permease
MNDILAFFYTKEEMGLRMGYWFGFAAIAGAFGGLVAFGIQHAHAAASHWRLLFIIEVTLFRNHSLNRCILILEQGCPTILLGLLALLLLPDRPEYTNYLDERERELAIRRMNRASSADVGVTITKSTHTTCPQLQLNRAHLFIRPYYGRFPRLEGQLRVFLVSSVADYFRDNRSMLLVSSILG